MLTPLQIALITLVSLALALAIVGMVFGILAYTKDDPEVVVVHTHPARTTIGPGFVGFWNSTDGGYTGQNVALFDIDGKQVSEDLYHRRFVQYATVSWSRGRTPSEIVSLYTDVQEDTRAVAMFDLSTGSLSFLTIDIASAPNYDWDGSVSSNMRKTGVVWDSSGSKWLAWLYNQTDGEYQLASIHAGTGVVTQLTATGTGSANSCTGMEMCGTRLFVVSSVANILELNPSTGAILATLNWQGGAGTVSTTSTVPGILDKADLDGFTAIAYDEANQRVVFVLGWSCRILGYVSLSDIPTPLADFNVNVAPSSAERYLNGLAWIPEIAFTPNLTHPYALPVVE